jgi:hypothetical protein
MTATLKRELEITLETALMLAEPDTSIPALAERIYNSEPRLMAECQRVWALERITWMLYRRQQTATASRQLCLPGFENLPQRITLKNGTRRALRSATLPLLIEFRDVLSRRRTARFHAVERLITLVAEYDKTHPDITVGEVIGLEAMKQERK